MSMTRIRLFGAALIWFSCCFALVVSQNITHPLEVSALKAVRRELKDRFGRLSNWKKNDPCSLKWAGVICYSDADPADGYLHVKELRLLHMNLTGKLSPQLGQFSRMQILNFMWNNISGSIPKEIGNMSYLQLLLLSGNQISGPLPDELGNLPNITKFQLDINYISGPIPNSFANLASVKHFHMNNNSISGQIPPDLYKLPQLVHFLLDNNNLSGYLPPELSQMPNIRIFQVNNNDFSGTTIPESYTNMSKLVKMTFRNCNLQGSIPDFSVIPGLRYLDLSSNHLTGSIPTNKLTDNITTIDLSRNMLNGSIPQNFSVLPNLERLSLENNLLSGTIPSTFWQNIIFKADSVLRLNFQNNLLSNISGSLLPPPNVSIALQGNPVCERENELGIAQFCGIDKGDSVETQINSSVSNSGCSHQTCPAYYENIPSSPGYCYCTAPLGVWMRLRSPSFSDFPLYMEQFQGFIGGGLNFSSNQIVVDPFFWEEGPRIRLLVKVFPPNSSVLFKTSELERVTDIFARFLFPSSDVFGPYDLLSFPLDGPYENFIMTKPSRSSMSKGVLVGIILGSISCGVTILLAIAFLYTRSNKKSQAKIEKRKPTGKTSCKIEGVKGFSFAELESATSGFDITSQIGQGGYGKVYKGILADGTVVAVKRAQQGSLQGEREFFTEIELLSRLHHRNLVSLIGYCDEEDEQMLVYEFLANGSLHSLLSARFRSSLGFAKRMQIALDSAKGILYLHTDADPPIIHRDIKANNILLDSKFTAKVSDFGISRLAPVSDDKDVTAQVSTVVKGTPGYLDPEYFLTRKLTEKSDVYSLGIVFLELLTGMPPISHGRNIVREVQSACQSGTMFSIIDRDMGPYNPECVKKFMKLALQCCQEETKARPTMLEIVRELEPMCSNPPQTTDANARSESSDVYASSSGGASSGLVAPPSQPYFGRNAYASSTDYVGSDLVSGVFPDIKPR